MIRGMLCHNCNTCVVFYVNDRQYVYYTCICYTCIIHVEYTPVLHMMFYTCNTYVGYTPV